jgi:hypothetical protein
MRLKSFRGIAVVLSALALVPVLASHQRAVAQEDIPARLTTLLKGHVYSGAHYRRETIRKVQYAPSQGLLGIEFDDAEESLPITAIIPMRDLGDMRASGGVASLSCKQPGCIKLSAESFLHSVAKLAQDPRAKLVGLKHIDVAEFGYKTENARAIFEALTTLARSVRGR